MVEKLFSCNDTASKPLTPKAPRSLLQPVKGGLGSLVLYNARHDPWENVCFTLSSEILCLIDKADMICQSKSGEASSLVQHHAALPAGVAVTDACQAGLLRLWLQVLQCFSQEQVQLLSALSPLNF